MKRTVTRLFDKQDQAEAAVRELRRLGVGPDDLSVVLRHAGAGPTRSFAEPAEGKSDTAEAVDTAVGAGEGLVAGGLIGGGAGLLTGLGILTIPGFGPVLAAGWLISTAIGATAGGVSGGALGGLLGALRKSGETEDDANVLAEGVRRGCVMVSVRVEEAEAARIEALLDLNSGARAASRGEIYRQEGWTHFDADAPSRPETGAQGPGAH